LSVIDQGTDGYSPAKLVRNSPQTNKDIYFTIRTTKTVIRSNRRNYSHRSVALYRTKKHGSTRANIEYLSCSFVEMDGSNGTVKTQEDVFTLIRENNLPKASYVIETSRGHFHLIWNYNNPLPWTTKNESYWIAQQKRLIQLFSRAGFLVDVGASMNPCQFLRNPSQLRAFNFKRRCKVYIHKTYNKTSLRRLYKALNGTNISNPKRVQASTKLRRDLRQNKTFITTHKAYAKKHGVSERTMRTEIKRAIANGDLQIVRRTGNNKRFTRATEYISNLYLEPNSQNGNTSSIKDNAVQTEGLLRDFKRKGASVGRRQKTIFALGLEIKAQLGERASVGALRAELEGGARHCHFPEKEFERTLKNIMKISYTNPFSLSKLREWNLIMENKDIMRKSNFQNMLANADIEQVKKTAQTLNDSGDVEKLSWLQELTSLKGDSVLSNTIAAQADGIRTAQLTDEQRNLQTVSKRIEKGVVSAYLKIV